MAYSENQHRGILQLIPGCTLPQKGAVVSGSEGLQLNALVFPVFTDSIDAFKLKRNIIAHILHPKRLIAAQVLSGNKTITEKILFDQE